MTWADAAACVGHPTALFYGPYPDAALAICSICPVVGPCRVDAEAHGDIVDGYTTHGQVVGGCGPYKPAKGEREPVMRAS